MSYACRRIAFSLFVSVLVCSSFQSFEAGAAKPAVKPAQNAPAAEPPRQSWEVTLTLLRAMDLLPRQTPKIGLIGADDQEGVISRPLHEANDADTIQTLYRRQKEKKVDRQVAALSDQATTGSSILNADAVPPIEYANDAADSLSAAGSDAVTIPVLTGNPKMTDLIYRQIVMKLAIVLYRQDRGRYPEGLDALTTGYKDYFQSALGLVPAASEYGKLASAALAEKKMPAPRGREWFYAVSPDGKSYVLGLAASGEGEASLDQTQPMVSNLLGTGELPILPGSTAKYVWREFKQDYDQRSPRR